MCIRDSGIALGLGDNSGYTQQDLTRENMNRLTLIDYWGRYKNIANVKGCSAVNYNWDTIDLSLIHISNSRDYKNMRECHVEPDWLLIYSV